MQHRRALAWTSFLACASLPAIATATTEPPTTQDARVISMGSTAVAHAHNGAAVYHNVAALHEVKTFTVTGNFAGLHIAQSAPVNGPDTSVDNDASLVPLFLLGGGYRVTDRLVLAFGAFTTGGFGSEYESTAPGPYRLTLGAIEFSPAATYSFTDNFAVGLGYRVTYMMQELGVRFPAPPPAPPGTMVDMVSDVSGFSPFGLHIGFYYRPIEALKLGFAYRSKTTAALSGTTTAGGQELDTDVDFSMPHGFRLGGAYEVLPERFTVAMDVRYLLHSEANEEIVTETEGMVDAVQVLDWNDSLFVGIGLEYFFVKEFAARAGYSLTTSATPEDRPAPFFLPAGILHTVHLGAGVRLEAIDIDLGGYYGVGASSFDGPFVPPDGPIPGEYTVDALAISAGVTYRQ